MESNRVCPLWQYWTELNDPHRWQYDGDSFSTLTFYEYFYHNSVKFNRRIIYGYFASHVTQQINAQEATAVQTVG